MILISILDVKTVTSQKHSDTQVDLHDLMDGPLNGVSTNREHSLENIETKTTPDSFAREMRNLQFADLVPKDEVCRRPELKAHD